MTNRLFSGDPLGALGEDALEALERAVAGLESERASDSPSTVEGLVISQTPRPPTLKRDQISFEGSEAELDSLDLLARPRKRWTPQFSFHVPFDGDARFFDLAGGAPLKSLEGRVEGNTLILTVSAGSQDAEEVISALEGRLDEIDRVLGAQKRYVDDLADDMRTAARTALQHRAQRLGFLDRARLALIEAGYRALTGEPEPLHREAS